MQPLLSKLYPYTKPYLGLIGVVLLYVIIEGLVPFGFRIGNGRLFTAEIPLICLIFSGLYYVQNNNKYRFWIAALPILIIYLTFSIHFTFFNRLLRVEDLYNVYEMLDVISMSEFIGLLILFTTPVVLLLINLRYSVGTLIITSIFSIAIIACIYFINNFSLPIQQFLEPVVKLRITGDDSNARKNGRIVSLLLYKIESNVLEQQFNAIDYNYSKYIPKNLITFNHKNIYVLVLESWLDPRRLSNVKFNINPVHQKWLDLIGNQKATIIKAPSIGGGTARSEFEILCGLPSLMLLGTIEWNIFKGTHNTYCLPHLLAQQGYTSSAAHPYRHFFTTEKNAYYALGFKNLYFGKLYMEDKENNSFVMEDSILDILYDGSFLQQYLQFIDRDRSAHTGNLHYALGMYGHSLFREILS